MVGQLLPLAYTLLKRNLFAEIIQSHLASRQEDKVDQLAPWAGGCRRGGILAFSGVGFGFAVLCVSVGLCPTFSKAFLMRGCLFVLVSRTKLSGAWRGVCAASVCADGRGWAWPASGRWKGNQLQAGSVQLSHKQLLLYTYRAPYPCSWGLWLALCVSSVLSHHTGNKLTVVFSWIVTKVTVFWIWLN